MYVGSSESIEKVGRAEEATSEYLLVVGSGIAS